MTTITFLNKDDFSTLAPALFTILDENMSAYSSMSYGEWYAAVSDGLLAPGRQILLVHNNGHLAGFLQFYTNPKLLMLEELQIAPQYQGKVNFLGRLYGFLLEHIPAELDYVEAYVHPENTRSLQLQRKLGLEVIDQERPWLHLRGEFRAFRQWYVSRR